MDSDLDRMAKEVHPSLTVAKYGQAPFWAELRLYRGTGWTQKATFTSEPIARAYLAGMKAGRELR